MQEDDRTRGAVPKELKIKNRRSVLTAFFKRNALSAIDAANMTGISLQTVQKKRGAFYTAWAVAAAWQGRLRLVWRQTSRKCIF
jgi:UDP-N-acetylmuramyl tripeptide synthase